MDLVIEGFAQATTDVDDTLDDIAEEVEAAIEGDKKFSGLALNSMLVSTEIELDGEGSKETGKITLTYKVLYQT